MKLTLLKLVIAFILAPIALGMLYQNPEIALFVANEGQKEALQQAADRRLERQARVHVATGPDAQAGRSGRRVDA
jgi:hypothetical protein